MWTWTHAYYYGAGCENWSLTLRHPRDWKHNNSGENCIIRSFIICTLYWMLFGSRNQKKWERKDMRRAYNILVRKPEIEKRLGSRCYRKDGNIKMDLEEMICKVVWGNRLALTGSGCGNNLLVLVKAVTNLRDPLWVEFLYQLSSTFCGRTVFHVVSALRYNRDPTSTEPNILPLKLCLWTSAWKHDYWHNYSYCKLV
jgi:hypothetical protein